MLPLGLKSGTVPLVLGSSLPLKVESPFSVTPEIIYTKTGDSVGYLNHTHIYMVYYSIMKRKVLQIYEVEALLLYNIRSLCWSREIKWLLYLPICLIPPYKADFCSLSSLYTHRKCLGLQMCFKWQDCKLFWTVVEWRLKKKGHSMSSSSSGQPFILLIHSSPYVPTLSESQVVTSTLNSYW